MTTRGTDISLAGDTSAGDESRDGCLPWRERVTRCADIAPAIARASAITMEGRPAVLEFITREEPVLSRFFTPTY